MLKLRLFLLCTIYTIIMHGTYTPNLSTPLLNQLNTYQVVLNPNDIKIAQVSDLKNIVIDIANNWYNRSLTQLYANLDDQKNNPQNRYFVMGKPLKKSCGQPCYSQRLQRIFKNKVNWKHGIYILPYLIDAHNNTLIHSSQDVNSEKPALIGIALYDHCYKLLGKDIICNSQVSSNDFSNGPITCNHFGSFRIGFNERIFCWLSYGEQLYIKIDDHASKPTKQQPIFDTNQHNKKSKLSWFNFLKKRR